jgi:perosamine synthetase
MRKLDWRVQRKKEIFASYQEHLSDVEEINFLPINLEEVPPWFIDVLVPNPLALKAYLAEHDIGSRPFYPAIHSQPAYNLPGSFPNSEYAASHGLWLPSSSFLEDDTIALICSEIRSFYQGG